MRTWFTAHPLHAGLAALPRIGIGLLFMQHGFMIWNPEAMAQLTGFIGQMGFPAPAVFAYMAKGSEFFGGILLALGLATRFAALFLAITMAVATFVAHQGQVTGEGELAAVYLLVSLYFLLAGPGPWSLDAMLKRR